MYKYLSPVSGWLISALLITTAAGCIEAAPELRREDMPRPENDSGTVSQHTVTLSFKECTFEGTAMTYPVSVKMETEVSISYPSGCSATPTIPIASWQAEGAKVVCTLNPSALLDKIVETDDFYVSISESYWLPSVQVVAVAGAKVTGSVVTQGRISLKDTKDHELRLPGVRSSGLSLSLPAELAPEQAVTVVKPQRPQAAPQGLSGGKSVVFHVPASCQLTKSGGTDSVNLLSAPPEWKIQGIKVSTSPLFD